MNKDYLKKAGFVVLILIAGFSLEYFFYRKKIDLASLGRKPGTKRVLLVGGSIIDTITPGLKSILQSKGITGFEFINLTHPLMSSGIAKRIIAENLDTLKPDIIFLLVGLDERNLPILNLERRKLLNEYILKNDVVGFNNYTIAVLNEILGKPSQFHELLELHLFFHGKAAADLLRPDLLKPHVLEIISHEMKNTKAGPARLVFLFMLAESLLLDQKVNRLDPEVPKRFIKNFDEFLRNKDNNTKRELFTEADFLWREQLERMAGKSDLRDYLLQSTDMLHGFGKRLSPYSERYSEHLENLDPRIGQILDRLKTNRDELAKKGASLSIKRAEIISNLAFIRNQLSQKDIPLILLQYPKLELDIIRQAGEELSLPVIKNKYAFKDITRDNYYQYFFDKTGETGHLTAYGSEVYARALIEQLPELFKQP